MAQNDMTGNSDGENLPDNIIDHQQRLSAERLGRRMRTYRDHDKVHSSHFNNSINTLVEEQQKQTSQLQQKSAETKHKKSNKKSDKRDNSLSMPSHIKNSRPLENDSADIDGAGKKQKLNDGSANKTAPAGEFLSAVQIKVSNSPIPSPAATSSGTNLQQDLDTSLGEINLAADPIGVKTEDGDFSSLSLDDGELINEDISNTIMTYLTHSNGMPNSESKDEFNSLMNSKLNYSTSDVTSSQTNTDVLTPTASCSTNYISDGSISSVQNNFPLNPEYKLRMQGLTGQNDSIPASQTLKQMAEVHQTKSSPTSVTRNMMDYNINSYNYPVMNTSSGTPSQMVNCYNPVNSSVPMHDFPQNRRQQMKSASPVVVTSITTMPVNPQNITNPNVLQHINPSTMLPGTQHNIPKKPQQTSPQNPAQLVMSQNHKLVNQSSQVQQSQNGTVQQPRMQPDPRHNQVQPGIMPMNPSITMKSRGDAGQASQIAQYQNSIPTMNHYSHAGPSVPSSAPFNTFGNTNGNMRGAYQCQPRMPPVQGQVQNPANTYMQGQMLNNVGMMRGQVSVQNKQVLRGPPPEYRQAAMMQHVGSPPVAQEVVNPMQFHAAAYRQTLQQQANQTLPPNIKMSNTNTNVAGFRAAAAMHRNRPTMGNMNSLAMSQGQQTNSWLIQSQSMSPPVMPQSYQESQLNSMQRNAQIMDPMTMHNTPAVANSSTNQMNMQQQCIQMVPRMRPEIRHGMQMSSPPGVMSHPNMNAMNRQMQTVPNHNNVHNMESYSVPVNNNVMSPIATNQMAAANIANMGHNSMGKVQRTQMNPRQNPIAMQINQARVPTQMMHSSPEMMQTVGMNSHMGSNYPQAMPGHNSPLQVPNHINGIPSNSPMGLHMPSNVMMHNSTQINHTNGPVMPQIAEIKTEPNSQSSQPTTPNNEYDMMFNDTSFNSLLK